MKKTTKIIISLAVVIVIMAVVLTVSLISAARANKEPTTTVPPYSLKATTLPQTTLETEAWVDLDQMASDLATATDTSNPSDTTTTTVPATLFPAVTAPVVPETTIVFVYVTEVTQTQATTVTQAEDIPQMQEYKYTIDPGTGHATLTRYLGDSTSVMIPSEISGHRVVAIGEKCFLGKNISNIMIGDSVTTIGNSAFQDCAKLKDVVFMGAPYTITVGDNAFKGCKKLKSINLPVAESIGYAAFEGCESLTSLIIKEGTGTIGEFCFKDCTSLVSLTIPESVMTIGQGAFNNHNDNLVVKCVAGSTADQVCKNKYSINVEYI